MSGYLFFWLVPGVIIAAACLATHLIAASWDDKRDDGDGLYWRGPAIIIIIVLAAVSVCSYVFGAIAWRYLV
jgi:hypothetical protein